jgi:hypothetical protein
MSSMKLSNVLMFAEEITNYYDSLSGEFERQKIVVYNGLKMLFSDRLDDSLYRSEGYNKMVERRIKKVRKDLPQLVYLHPKQKKYDGYGILTGHIRSHSDGHGPNKKYHLEVSVEKTNEADTIAFDDS